MVRGIEGRREAARGTEGEREKEKEIEMDRERDVITREIYRELPLWLSG